MNLLDPEKLFREYLEKNPGFNFRSLVLQTDVQYSLQAALAAMASRGGTTEEMKGATRFITTWLNLAEQPKTPPQFADKKLNYAAMKPLDPSEKNPAS